MDASSRSSMSSDYSYTKPGPQPSSVPKMTAPSGKRSLRRRLLDAVKDLGSPPTEKYDQANGRKTPGYADFGPVGGGFLQPVRI